MSRAVVRMGMGEPGCGRRYDESMPRKSPPVPPRMGPADEDWFLTDWMKTCKVRQADLCRETGIPKATMSAIHSGKTNYYRELVNKVAKALNIKPYELLMHPDDAMAIRRLRSSAMQIASVQLAADQSREWAAEPELPPAFRKVR